MTAALTIVRSSRRIGYRLDGMNWVRKTTQTSSTGSIQNAVDAAPPHQYSPAEPATASWPRRWSSRSRGRSRRPGRWLRRTSRSTCRPGRARRAGGWRASAPASSGRAGAPRRARRRGAGIRRSAGSRPAVETRPPPPEGAAGGSRKRAPGQRHQLACGRVHVALREARGLVLGDVEGGVDHAQRAQDALLQELLERHAGDLAHQVAEHVGRDRVVPGRAGRELQRQLGQARR